MKKAVVQQPRKPNTATSGGPKDSSKKRPEVAKGEYEKIREDEMNDVFEWIDKIKLSRPRKNFQRDFADGVLMAELLANFYPKLVDLHNYQKASSAVNKIKNWETLQHKVFSKIGFTLPPQLIRDIGDGKKFALEHGVKKFYDFICDEAEVAAEKKAIESAKIASTTSMAGCEGDFLNHGFRQDVCYIRGQPPNHIIVWEGETLVPGSWVDDREKKIDELNEAIRILKTKSRRQETLIDLRGKKLEEMAEAMVELEKSKDGMIKKMSAALETADREKKLKLKWVDPTGLV